MAKEMNKKGNALIKKNIIRSPLVHPVFCAIDISQASDSPSHVKSTVIR